MQDGRASLEHKDDIIAKTKSESLFQYAMKNGLPAIMTVLVFSLAKSIQNDTQLFDVYRRLSTAKMPRLVLAELNNKSYTYVGNGVTDLNARLFLSTNLFVMLSYLKIHQTKYIIIIPINNINTSISLTFLIIMAYSLHLLGKIIC
mgnify:CR=1 FL=1